MFHALSYPELQLRIPREENPPALCNGMRKKKDARKKRNMNRVIGIARAGVQSKERFWTRERHASETPEN
jgi:hypothetical protein